MRRRFRRNDDTVTRVVDDDTFRQSATRPVVPVGGSVGDYLVKITYPNGQYHNIMCHDVDECYEIVSWAQDGYNVPDMTIVNMLVASKSASGYTPLRRWVKSGGKLVGSRYPTR